MSTHDDLHVSSGFLITLLRVKQERGRKERSRASQRSLSRPDDKERLRGSPGEGAPEQAEYEKSEKREAQSWSSAAQTVFSSLRYA